ncbi:MAG: LysR family transcriptional regulator [Myxococcales bacterium]|nr:LysR family transcriptional regulator [Myxococcales bacterium]
MVGQPSWELIPLFLAAARTGGLRSAAAQQGISHATLRRRLQALEQSTGVKLFDRRHDGLHPTPAGRALVAHAEGCEERVRAFFRIASGLSASLDGPVQVSAPDLLVSELLACALADFSEQHPGIRLRVDTTYGFASLRDCEADVALRLLPPGQLPDGDLIGFKAAEMSAAVYGEGERWLGWSGEEDAPAATPFDDADALGEFNNVYLQRSLCRAGRGLARLPCFMAGGLRRRSERWHGADAWVLVHPDLRHMPRVRLFRQAMVEALAQAVGDEARHSDHPLR